ncbi:1-deoxy-D-xylulose-5-phosphate reductoisomerase [candidate division KSB1 bacterium]|nr:1-deoxy-D-xylulose-5-phosphate reductoisomerase [candidate division KSB1 bacterium]
MQTTKKILILGSTGSIGTNCLHIVEQMREAFQVVGLATFSRVEKLLEQARLFHPEWVAVSSGQITGSARKTFRDLGVHVFSGAHALEQISLESDYNMMVNAVVGAAGFLPTLHAIGKGADIALANKETLVIGGELVMAQAKKQNVAVLPVDSEHSAIFQSLMGESSETVEQIILTASGGPFRTWSKELLSSVTVEQALKHPNWNMGKKITIDSATMMNKGLEVIEAIRLFHVSVDKIKVVIHPQSVIHSMVAFIDGSVKAQLGVPDMRVPIQLALTYPERKFSRFPRLDFGKYTELTFEEPDLNKFQALALAFEAGRIGGTAPAVLNAANEVAVSLFLNRKIRFDQIPQLVEQAVMKHQVVQNPDKNQLLAADLWARQNVERFI